MPGAIMCVRLFSCICINTHTCIITVYAAALPFQGMTAALVMSENTKLTCPVSLEIQYNADCVAVWIWPTRLVVEWRREKM